jgi:GTP cyclohydrolase IA
MHAATASNRVREQRGWSVARVLRPRKNHCRADADAVMGTVHRGLARVGAPARDGVLQRNDGPGIDRPRAEEAVRDLLVALGRDLTDHGLGETPRRVAAAFAELLSHEPVSLTTFANDEGYDELVVVREIPFHSLCMHHLLPFHGVAHVAYLPGERIVGLSKLARVVERFSRELQLQERLTMQIATCLQGQLRPKGVGVVLEAEHSCMSLRGVRKAGTRTTTSALLGWLRDDARTRQEFLSLVTA